MTIVDAHCHIYPEKIAANAVQSVGEFYTIEMDGDGTTTRLNQFMEEAGITTTIGHSVAVKPKPVTSINDFIIESCKENPSYVGFMTMHPDFEAVIDDTLAIRDRLCPTARVTVLSNGKMLHKPRVCTV